MRPELAVFERVLRDRVQRLKGLENERFARPVSVERESSSGDLCVLAEFITGSRLSELLEVSADAAVVPGVDVALGYLVETLSGLSALHATSRIVHGLVDPSRTVITADGQVVLLDLAFGPVVELLHPSIERLWSEFGIASMARDDRFNVVGDITQAGLNALMLVLGRNLKPHEFPDAIPSLLMEVIEVAHIRGSTTFANALQRFLQRSLPLPGRRPFATAAEALDDVNQLMRREIGADVCRQAIVDFVAQMDAAFAQATERAAAEEMQSARGAVTPHVPELDSFLDSFETVDEPSAAGHDGRDPHATAAIDEDEGEELEISFDLLDADTADRRAVVARGRQEKPDEDVEVYDLHALDDFNTASSDAISSALKTFEDGPASPAAAAPWPTHTFDRAPAEPGPASPRQPAVATAPEPPPGPTPIQTPAPEPAATAPPPPVAVETSAEEPTDSDAVTPSAAAEDDEILPASQEAATELDRTHGSSRRRKRQQQKSARARKDKLRSTTADQKVPSGAPPPPAARPVNPSGWLVSPQRAAASESLIPPPVPAPPPPPAPAMPSFSPSPVGAFPQPTYANPAPPSVYGTPTPARPAPPPAPPPPPPPPPPAPVATVRPSSMGTVQPSSIGTVQPSARVPLKLKEEPPAAVAPRRTIPEPFVPPPDRFSLLSLGGAAQEEPKGFPWKLAAIAVGVAIIAIVLGRSYLPGRAAVEGEPGAQSDSPSATAPATPHALPNDDAPVPAGKGRVLVQTQPAGIKVMVDRKSVGETPLRLDLPPGRRVLTFLTSGGEVMQSVRVVAGKTVTLDIPVFSGWVSVVAPFVLDIAEDGRGLGTTEQNRIMLPPGRHKLTFSHKEYGYSSTQDVDVEPGGVRTVTVDPKGTAAINATPWAEVWLDGTKLGETPLASTPVPLGTHEFVFKHPELGERRVTATIRANATSTVSADFGK